MNDESLKDTRGATTATAAAIRALVDAGQEKFTRVFSEKRQRFDAMIWDVGELNDRPATQVRKHLYFTRYETLNQALPLTYAEVVKSWLILELKTVGSMSGCLDAARLLWEAIVFRRRNDPTTFSWQDLCEEDLNQAELLMREHWEPGTVYKEGVCLLSMIDFLAARSICRPLYYVLQTPYSEHARRFMVASQNAQREKLPSKKALEGVADIYSTHAKNPADRLRAAALALLVVTGFRLGELLTLPLVLLC